MAKETAAEREQKRRRKILKAADKKYRRPVAVVWDLGDGLIHLRAVGGPIRVEPVIVLEGDAVGTLHATDTAPVYWSGKTLAELERFIGLK